MRVVRRSDPGAACERVPDCTLTAVAIGPD